MPEYHHQWANILAALRGDGRNIDAHAVRDGEHWVAAQQDAYYPAGGTLSPPAGEPALQDVIVEFSGFSDPFLLYKVGFGSGSHREIMADRRELV